MFSYLLRVLGIVVLVLACISNIDVSLCLNMVVWIGAFVAVGCVVTHWFYAVS